MFNKINKLLINKMDKCLNSFKLNIKKFNLNSLDLNIIGNIFIDYFGKKVLLNKLSNIFMERNFFKISLFDKNIKNIVKKSILNLNLDVSIFEKNNDILIRIPILTEEKRYKFVKLLKNETELVKICIRNIRHEFKKKIRILFINKEISKDENKIFNKKIQNITNLYIKNIEFLFLNKKKYLIGN